MPIKKRNIEKTDLISVAVQTDPVVIKDAPVVFKCLDCSRRYKNRLDLEEHKRVQTCIPLDKRSYCCFCDIRLDNREDYRKHLLTQSHITAILES